jgi:hypothetical protein
MDPLKGINTNSPLGSSVVLCVVLAIAFEP